MRKDVVCAVLFASTAAVAAPVTQTIAVCSPGAAGTTADAQPALDAFAAALTPRAGAPMAATFDATDDAGVTQLKTAGIALVSLPFFLKHEQELGLHARLIVVEKGRPALDRWTLVARKGRVTSAAALDGFTISTSAAFAPAFVRGSALGGFGAVPASTKLAPATAVLSALRRAANGDPVAVLLDGTQQASLASLPFAAQLDTAAQSPPMPAGVIATVDARMPAKTWAPIEAAFVALPADKTGAAALATMGIGSFAPIDAAALDAARTAYKAAAK